VLYVDKTTVEDEGHYECEVDDYSHNPEKESVFVRINSELMKLYTDNLYYHIANINILKAGVVDTYRRLLFSKI